MDDGERFERFVKFAPGTPENPLDSDGVNAKARSLIAALVGPKNAEALIARITELETLRNVRELRPLLRP